MSLKYKKWAESPEGKKWLKENPGKKGDFKTYFTGESLTRQEFKDDCDINRIVDKYTRTGRLPYDADNLGIYVDVSEVGDYQSALAFVTNAKESFNKLDVNVRKRFENSPQKLLDFLKDPENTDEAIKLGLAKDGSPKIPETTLKDVVDAVKTIGKTEEANDEK